MGEVPVTSAGLQTFGRRVCNVRWAVHVLGLLLVGNLVTCGNTARADPRILDSSEPLSLKRRLTASQRELLIYFIRSKNTKSGLRVALPG